MVYEIVINKRFTNKLLKLLDYLKKEWGTKLAREFAKKVHNRLYYRIAGNKIVILNLYDNRSKKTR